jgi:anti-sigma regulatory factor (Ser/Thr protein kinase)
MVGQHSFSTTSPATPDFRRVVLTTHRGELRRLAVWVAAVARDNALPLEAAFRIDLCLAEAVSNVIEHGFADGGRHDIRVTLEPRATEIVLTVEDEGRPFDPLEAVLPPLAARVEEARIGGYGLRLLRHFADSCRYQRWEGRNILTMILLTPSR